MVFFQLPQPISEEILENMSLQQKMEFCQEVNLRGDPALMSGALTPPDILDIINLKKPEDSDHPLSIVELNDCIESTRVCYRESAHFKSILAKASAGEQAGALSLNDWIILGFVASPEQIKALPVEVLDKALKQFIENHSGVTDFLQNLSKREVPMEQKPKLDHTLRLFIKNCAALALVHPDYLKESKHANVLMTLIKHFIFRDSTPTRLNLEGAHFRLLEDKNIFSPELKHAILRNADLFNAVIYPYASFELCDLRGGRFSNVPRNVWLKFLKCDFRMTDFNAEGSFFYASFTGSDFSGSRMNNMTFAECSFDGANLNNVQWKNVNFNSATFNNASIRDADLSDSSLIDANLSETNLAKTNLSDVYLENCTLAHVDLTGTNLSETSLAGEDLSGLDLTNACLHACNLKDTILTGVNLTNTTLSSIDLSGKNLDGVVLGGSGLQLEHVKILGIPKSAVADERSVRALMDDFYKRYCTREETKQCTRILRNLAADELAQWIVSSLTSQKVDKGQCLIEAKELLSKAMLHPAFSVGERNNARLFTEANNLPEPRRIIQSQINDLESNLSKLTEQAKNAKL